MGQGRCKDEPAWDYYQRWLLALERLLVESKLLRYEELEKRTRETLSLEQRAV